MKKHAKKKVIKKKTPIAKYTGYIQIPLGALISMNTTVNHEQVMNRAFGDDLDMYKVKEMLCTIVFDMRKCPVTITE